MTAATVSKPKAKKLFKESPKPTQVRKPRSARKCSGKLGACKNCEAKKGRPTKKKPVRRPGAWRGLFSGTPDF